MNPTTTSKDLGLVAAIIAGSTPPSNTDILWLDVNTTPAIKKYYDTTDGTWKPLIAIQQNSNDNILTIKLGDQIVFVSKEGNDYTGIKGDLAKCFNTIGGAYNYAKTLAPSINKRIVVAVYPGTYIEDIVMDTDFINIVSAVPQELIYNTDLINGFTFSGIKRKYYVNGKISILTKQASLKGIDVNTLSIKPYFSNSIDIKPILNIENLIAQTITNPITSGEVTGNFYDVHAENFLNSDAQTDLSGTFVMCGGNKAFRSGIATFASNVWHGGIKNATFELCYGGNGSFGGLGGYMYNSKMHKCAAKNNCISTIEQCELKIVSLGNTCIKNAINTLFNLVVGGTNCMWDFTDIIAQDCDFGAQFAASGTGDFVSGNLNNVTSDYSNGFAEGRLFWGKMRRMFARCTNINKPTLNLVLPSDGGVDRVPSTIEHSTLLHCVSGSAYDPIMGAVAYISYCKFNQAYSATNALGTDDDARNIINSALCSYSGVACVAPTLFDLVTSSFVAGAPITFTFDYQMPVTRAGSQIEITRPNLTVEIVNIVGNNGGSSSGTLTYVETVPIAGAYSFRLRTVCSYDGSGAVLQASAYTGYITANVTNSSRATAWRPKDLTKYCVISALNERPVFGKLTIESLDTVTTYFPDAITPQEKSIVNTGKIRLSFFSDTALTVPVTFVNQDFRIFLKNRNHNTSNTYVDPDSLSLIHTYNAWYEALSTVSFTNISGTSVLLNGGSDYELSGEYDQYTPTHGIRLGATDDISYSLFPDSELTDGKTGYKEWTTLEQYYTDNNLATGVEKPNVVTDGDYVSPAVDTTLCPSDAPETHVSYGQNLLVTSTELAVSGTPYSPDLPTTPFNSDAGGSIFRVRRLPGQATQVSMQIHSTYTGGVTTPGKIQIQIIHAGGISHYQINDFVRTIIGTFVDIESINASNF